MRLHDVTFELRARDDGGARTVASIEIGRAWAPAAVAPPLAIHEHRLVHAFPAVETDPARLQEAAALLRTTAAALRAERLG